MAGNAEHARRETEEDNGRHEQPPADPGRLEHVAGRRDEGDAGCRAGERQDAAACRDAGVAHATEEELEGEAGGEHAGRGGDQRPAAVGAVDLLNGELGHIEARGDGEHTADPGQRRRDELDGATSRRDRDSNGTNGRGDDRGREVTGAERVAGEQDRDGVGAGRDAAEDEALLQPDPMRREPDANGSEPGEKPGLRARRRLGRREDAGAEQRKCQRSDRGRGDPGDGLLEDQPGRRVDEEHVRRGDGAVDEGCCLQAGIANPQGDEGQEQRLGRPGDREARSRQQVGGRDGGEGKRRDTEHEREGRLHTAEREPRAGPDHRRPGKRVALVAVDIPERPHEQEREADRSEHERARERIEIRLAGDELQPDPCCEHDQHVRGEDGGRACARRRIGIESEKRNLCSNGDSDPDQQLVPTTRHGENHRRTEDDHRERHGGPGEPRVDRLQGRGECGPEQPDRGHRLGRPRDRDHDGHAPRCRPRAEARASPARGRSGPRPRPAWRNPPRCPRRRRRATSAAGRSATAPRTQRRRLPPRRRRRSRRASPA